MYTGKQQLSKVFIYLFVISRCSLQLGKRGNLLTKLYTALQLRKYFSKTCVLVTIGEWSEYTKNNNWISVQYMYAVMYLLVFVFICHITELSLANSATGATISDYKHNKMHDYL